MKKKIISALIVLSMMLSMFSFMTVIAKDGDVLIQFMFEDDEEWGPWSGKSVDLTTYSTDGYTEGKRSLFVNDNSEALATGMQSGFIEIEPGKTYTASTDMLLAHGTVNFYLRYFDADDKQIFSKNVAGTPGKWNNLVITREAPATAVSAKILVATGGSTQGAAYFDNMKLVEGKAQAVQPKNAKIPENLPEPPKEEEFIPVDDGIPVGTVMYENSFEEEFKDWAYKGPADVSDNVRYTDETASDGKKSVYVLDDSKSNSPGLISTAYEVAAGNCYKVSIDAKVVSGTSKMYVFFLDEAKAQIKQQSKSFPTGDWQTTEFSVVTPNKTKYIQVQITGNVNSLGESYVDNFKIIKAESKDVAVSTLSVSVPPKQVASVDATLVAPDGEKLKYNAYTENGDILADFSYAGFAAGEYNLPDSRNLPVVATLSPTGTEDDSKMIQDAIDKAYNEAVDNSFKVIKLKAGKYNITNNVLLKSGIILSGEGQGPTGTELYASEAKQYMVLKAIGNLPTLDEYKANILDEYVPTGKKTFTLSEEDAKRFAVGDLIAITFPATDEWAKHVEMVGLVNTTGGNSSWGGEKQNVVSERTITEINGNQITVDNGIFVPLPKNLGQSFIQKVNDSGRMENVGVENMRIVSYYNGTTTDENHATVAFKVERAKNVYMKDVTAKHFYGSIISTGTKAKQVTALNCSSVEPVSKITGSRRYMFAVTTSAQQVLYAGCYSHAGRHDYETSFEVTGPIVFLDSVADQSYGGIETHGTWASGILYDNVYSISNSTDASIGIKNHGYYGSTESQGWTGVTGVIWNSLAPAIIVHRPPAPYQNFMVGSWGIYDDPAGREQKQANIDRYIGIYRSTSHLERLSEADVKEHFATKDGSPYIGDGYVENEFTPVNPRSLFKAQLAERFTGNFKNARANAPTIENPKYDKVVSHDEIIVDGFYQLGASKVTVYIDDEPVEATLKENNSFTATKKLKEGVHKIYATQTIDGVESVKGPDRFITVGKENGNPDYLQSLYDISKTSFLVNDPRPTYDVISNKQSGESNDKIKVMINGQRLVSDVDPFETNGRVLVPMRAIFEALSATVTWDEASATAVAIKDGKVIQITENQKTTFVNGAPYELDVPATILNGRFVVPVRFISESFGCIVDWIDATKTVVITSK